MTTIAAWMAERGAKLILLEQIRGSTSIFATLKTQYSFRTFNFYTILLIGLWGLSPLGAQAILRVLSTTNQPSTTQVMGYYLNTTAIGEADAYEEQNLWVLILPTNLYLSALMSPTPPEVTEIDMWGNVKIPMLEALDPTSEVDGWIPVPDGNISYSSMIGIRITNISSIGISDVQITSSYFVFNCDQPEIRNSSSEVIWSSSVPQEGFQNCPDGIGSQRFDSDGTLLSTFSLGTHMNLLASNKLRKALAPRDLSDDVEVSLEMLFQSVYNSEIQATNCTVENSVVDSKVRCVGGNCSVTHMRSSDAVTEVNPLAYCYTTVNFFQNFVSAAGQTADGSSATEAYIAYNKSPLEIVPDGISSVPLYEVPGPEFSERLTRVMNTYWIAANGRDSILTNSTSLDNNPAGFPGSVLNTTVNITITEEQFVCHNNWLAVLLISSAVLLIIATLDLVLKYLIIGPDVFGTISSMTRDNQEIPQAEGGTFLDGYERTRLLRSLRVRLGDVKPDQGIGHIALATLDREEKVERMKKGRLYQ
jgi:hypothetical protein